MVSERYGIDIAELVVYILLLPLALFVTFRQGFSRSAGFLYLCIFCIIRIASSAVGILSEKNPDSKDDMVWAAILGSVGISPLLLASFSLLTRVNKNSVPASQMRIRTTQILHLPSILALVLAIIGGTRLQSSDTSKQSQGKKLAQAGIVIFMVIFAIYVIICLLTLLDKHAAAAGENRILYGALLALPFIFVRIVYSLLANFWTKNLTFALVGGNPTVQLCMSIIEEMIVVVIYIGIGMTAPIQSDAAPMKSKYPLQPATA